MGELYEELLREQADNIDKMSDEELQEFEDEFAKYLYAKLGNSLNH